MVVLGHACSPASHFTSQFHMPLFFIISGYLFNSRNTVKEFIIRKINSLYLPFVIWNLLFIGLTIVKNILTSTPTLGYAVKAAIKTLLTLDKHVHLGATWFLGALFVMSVLYKLCDTYINPKCYKRIIITAIFTALGILGFAVNLPYFFSRTLILGMFFAFGYVVQENKEILKQYNKPIVALVCLGLFLVIALNNSAHMGHNEYTSPVQFVIGACCASYFVIWLSNVLADCSVKGLKPVGNCLEMLGKRSLDIVIWHFVFFNLVIALQLAMEGVSPTHVFDHLHTYITTEGWWAVYLLVGIVVPLLWCDFLRMGPWGKFLKKIHAV